MLQRIGETDWGNKILYSAICINGVLKSLLFGPMYLPSGVLRMGGRFRPGAPAISEDWEEEEVRAALQNLACEAQEEFLEEW